MTRTFLAAFIFLLAALTGNAQQVLVYHNVQTDQGGNLIPWYNPNHGSSYDHDLNLIWNFWKNIPTTNGAPYYMTDHSYSTPSSANFIGGDQFAMALSSWGLYYAYTGDQTLIDNMKYIADTYLANSLSGSGAAWPNLPYPCNYSLPTVTYYDGDFILGAGITQPDKAGSFAAELVTLYKITGDTTYLSAAVKIANTLAAKVQPGDSTNSPYPFKVNAQTGAIPNVLPGSSYTGNVVPTLRLFEDLSKMGVGQTQQYDSAYAVIKHWVQQYPQHTNQWGSFFEDIPVPSNTETNAVTMAWYILEHPNWSNTWQQDARSILDWTLNTLRSHAYDSLGVTAIYEQTADLKEGGSHTSRFGSVELVYCDKTGDTSRRTQAIRQLDWATYLCDFDGKVRFSPREGSIWYTDGYGDYVRHYLRAMEADPRVAPDSANHLLGSSSVISNINYQPAEITYTTFDAQATETLKLTSKPLQVKANGQLLTEQSNLNSEGWVWTAYTTGGCLKVKHNNAKNMDILWNGAAITEIEDPSLALQVFPNPASDNMHIKFTSVNEGQAKIELIDLQGRIVKETALKAHAAENDEDLVIKELPLGSYFVRLATANGQSVKKISITR